jgi:CubicO group peptidase (beta-lactamase class C family)
MVMMKNVLVFLSAAIWALACAAPGLAEPSLPRVDDAMRRLVEQGQFAGAATVVFKDGELVDRAAFGKRDLATGAPMTPDTIVRAFSMTKPVTAVAMMILFEEGRWKPEDPVSKFIPELANVKVFAGLDSQGRPILEAPAHAPTVGELLTHTAGFSYGFDSDYVDGQYRAANLWTSQSTDEFAAKIGKLPLAYQPGTQWRYSISMDLEGVLIERLSGMSLPDFMRTKIFSPLGMSDTDFHVPETKRHRLAALYEWKDGKLSLATSDFLGVHPGKPPEFASGGGGLLSTADDYARFGRMLLGEGSLDGRRVISRASAKTIMSNHLPARIVNGRFGIGIQQIRPGYQYGYNGVVVTDPAAAKVAVGKGAYLWDGLASTWFWVDPTNQIVFVGMVQRVVGANAPPVQPLTQAAVQESYGFAGLPARP